MGGKDAFLLISMFIVIFFLFSVAGWIMEVTLKFIQFHRFINRGFLVGPYCPIYGWGAVTVAVLVGGVFARQGTVGETFLAGMVLCGALEYFTSWYMEKVFHARWWDYSQKPMNLHGRIWIGNLLLFGAASVVIVKLIVPLLLHWMSLWPRLAVEIAAGAVVVVMGADYGVSHVLMNQVKREIDAQDGDSTEEIAKKVRELLRSRSVFLRRIQSAYPNAQPRSKRLVEQWKQAQAKLKAAEQEFKENSQKYGDELKRRLEQGSEKAQELREKGGEKAQAIRAQVQEKMEGAREKPGDQALLELRKRMEESRENRKNARAELKRAERKLFGQDSDENE